MVSGTSLCFFPPPSDSQISAQGEEGEGSSDYDCSGMDPLLLAFSSSSNEAVRGVEVASEWLPPSISCVTTRGSIQAETSGLDVERLGLLNRGVPESLTNILQASRRSSTARSYLWHWHSFNKWSPSKELDPGTRDLFQVVFSSVRCLSGAKGSYSETSVGSNQTIQKFLEKPFRWGRV